MTGVPCSPNLPEGSPEILGLALPQERAIPLGAHLREIGKSVGLEGAAPQWLLFYSAIPYGELLH